MHQKWSTLIKNRLNLYKNCNRRLESVAGIVIVVRIHCNPNLNHQRFNSELPSCLSLAGWHKFHNSIWQKCFSKWSFGQLQLFKIKKKFEPVIFSTLINYQNQLKLQEKIFRKILHLVSEPQGELCCSNMQEKIFVVAFYH